MNGKSSSDPVNRDGSVHHDPLRQPAVPKAAGEWHGGH